MKMQNIQVFLKGHDTNSLLERLEHKKDDTSIFEASVTTYWRLFWIVSKPGFQFSKKRVGNRKKNWFTRTI